MSPTWCRLSPTRALGHVCGMQEGEPHTQMNTCRNLRIVNFCSQKLNLATFNELCGNCPHVQASSERLPPTAGSRCRDSKPDIMRGKSLNWRSPLGSFPCRLGNPMKEGAEKTVGVRGAGGHQENMDHQINQGEFTRANRDLND